jgi:ParB family chromosome partitioning protein
VSLAGFLDEVKIRKTRLSRRSLRADLGNLEELQLSISKIGLLQPIVVRPVEDGYEVVAGNRRFEACHRLGWIKIPCHIVELNDKEAFEVSLVENVQRNMLNPIEEAEAFKRYVQDYGWGGVSELARRIGKSQVYVSKRIRLMSLPVDIRMEIARRHISPSIGEELLSLDDVGHQIELGRRAAGERLSRNDIRSMVKTIHEGGAPEYGVFNDTIPYSYSDLEKQQHITDRALSRSIAALKVALHRIDDSLETLEDDWVIRELLFEHRKAVHSHIDALLNLRKRLSRYPLPR